MSQAVFFGGPLHLHVFNGENRDYIDCPMPLKAVTMAEAMREVDHLAIRHGTYFREKLWREDGREWFVYVWKGYINRKETRTLGVDMSNDTDAQRMCCDALRKNLTLAIADWHRSTSIIPKITVTIDTHDVQDLTENMVIERAVASIDVRVNPT